ncbi:hypothetical protein ACN4EG_03390 [Alkalinema pantanalense CENA528]|uniref:hypothetical protein n=1 Tax=Alkalinema pantanalense TaxID=1620705 RepID=UPI003D6F3211
MTTQLSVIRFMSCGITILLLGMGSTACQAFPKNAATPALPTPYTPSEYKKPPLTEEEKAWAAMPYEDQVEFMIKQYPELKFLLSEKHKFRQMGTACNLSPRTPQEKAIPKGLYHFMGPYKVTSKDLLLIGECGFNTTYVTRNVVVFHYNTQTGVNPIPLQLIQPTPTDPNASAHYFREKPSAFNRVVGK